MAKELTRKGFRRFLFWIGYDGSQFGEFAKGETGRGVMEMFELCVANCTKCHITQMKTAPVSRTDKFVHAIRSSILVNLPLDSHWIDESEATKRKVLANFNELTAKLARSAMYLHDFHGVSPGFSPAEHISYRYVYRICVPKTVEIAESLMNTQSLASFSEKFYAWRAPPSFDVRKASLVCEVLQSRPYSFASFYKHPLCLRRRGLQYRNTVRRLYHVKIERGEEYLIPNEEFDYYNISFVARGFLREQIRRTIAVLVNISCGKLPMSFLHDRLNRPDPQYLQEVAYITAAPPGGLFLADVVYDPRMFEAPFPYAWHGWDYDLPAVDDNSKMFEEDENWEWVDPNLRVVCSSLTSSTIPTNVSGRWQDFENGGARFPQVAIFRL